MQEIEFRGKSNKKWLYGYFIQALDTENKPLKNCIIENMSNFDISSGRLKQDCYEINLNTLGRYIGRDDRNGKKIFEGDIVKYGCICSDGENNEYIEESVGLVYFNCEDCCFCIHYNSHDGYITDDYFNDIEYVEVIGNIHDNPELLEVADGKN